MSKTLILLPEARKDIAEAYSWYEEQSFGLGIEFLRCIEATLRSIQRTPLIYPITYKTYHRAFTHRFPFSIFYETESENNCCVIYAVFHCSQDPNKWHIRMN